MPKQPHRSFRFEPFLNALIVQSLDPAGQLGFGHARLHAPHLHNDVTGPAGWRRDVIQPEIVESVKPPCFHRYMPLKSLSKGGAAVNSTAFKVLVFSPRERASDK